MCEEPLACSRCWDKGGRGETPPMSQRQVPGEQSYPVTLSLEQSRRVPHPAHFLFLSHSGSLAAGALAQCSGDRLPLKIPLRHCHAVRDAHLCARFGGGRGQHQFFLKGKRNKVLLFPEWKTTSKFSDVKSFPHFLPPRFAGGPGNEPLSPAGGSPVGPAFKPGSEGRARL